MRCEDCGDMISQDETGVMLLLLIWLLLGCEQGSKRSTNVKSNTFFSLTSTAVITYII